MFQGGDPQALQAQAGALAGTGRDVAGVASEASAAARMASGSVGSVELVAAVDRFGAAINGGVLACVGACTTLGTFSSTMSEQLTAVTGGR